MIIDWLKSFIRNYKGNKTRADCRELAVRFKTAMEKNTDKIPVLVVSYNNGIYVKNTVMQLQKRGVTPVVIDNCSNDLATQEILQDLEQDGWAYVVLSDKNFGHTVGFIEPIYNLLPDVFAYTDPDLEFSPTLPIDFLAVLSELTNEYAVFKAGFALDLMEEAKAVDGFIRTRKASSKNNPIAIDRTFSFRAWEAQFWRMRLAHESLEVYAAALDTTFAVYRKSNYQGSFFDGVRVAGEYKAIHLPWFPDLDITSEEERKRYVHKNKSTSWVG
ncbi:MAG: glycosyltransferase [Halioglobus sp.]